MWNGIEATTCLQIVPQAPESRTDCLHCAARIIWPDGREDTLWFEVAPDTPVTSLADPFLVGMLFEVMAAGMPVRVEGPVSAGLLWRLQEFMAVWAHFMPGRYQQVEIDAASVVPDPAPAAASVSTFSGGADSCFTAWRHAQGDPRFPKIDAGLMVHGLDIPLDDPVFATALASSRQMLESLGMASVWMRTNIRAVSHQSWQDTFGSALAACLHLLAPGYGRAFIPSSFGHSAGVHPVGSNPLTDPMLGSDAMQIIHDGAVYARSEKLRAISDWPVGMSGLRVCWQGAQRDSNCCRCEKCVRNMLNFQLLGLPVPSAFPLPLTAGAIRALRFGPTEVIIWRGLRDRVRGSATIAPDIKAAVNAVTRRMVLRNLRKTLSRRLRGRR